MSFIIGSPCVSTCDTACVAVCPVDCIHGPIDIEGRGEEVAGMTIGPKDMLYINPEECIDCGACLPECPVDAFYDDEDSAIKNGELESVNKNYEFFGQKLGNLINFSYICKQIQKYKYKTKIMCKFFEVTVEVVVATLKNGKDKKAKEIYLVDAQSVTEAESRVVKDFEDSGVQIDYKVSGAKESRVLRVIE